MRTVWQSEETRLDALTRTRELRDCLEVFLSLHRGEPALIQLTSGEQIPSILLGYEPHGHGLLIIRRGTAQPHIIRITHIESIRVM